MGINYVNLLEQEKVFAKEKRPTPTGLVWDTNMAAISLFWDTNMAAVTSCENTLYDRVIGHYASHARACPFLNDCFHF